MRGLKEMQMPSLMTSLGVDRLTTDEKLNLVDEILESLDGDSDFELTDDQKQELHRRITMLDAKQTTTSPWADVEARILARLKK
jgi:putative addiction module component (TIGR02574 family)